MSTKIYRKVVHKAIYRSMSINLYRRVVHENKYLCFENSFPYMENACVMEAVRTRGMGHTYRHSCRNVHNFTWMYVCLSLHEHLDGE